MILSCTHLKYWYRKSHFWRSNITVDFDTHENCFELTAVICFLIFANQVHPTNHLIKITIRKADNSDTCSLQLLKFVWKSLANITHSRLQWNTPAAGPLATSLPDLQRPLDLYIIYFFFLRHICTSSDVTEELYGIINIYYMDLSYLFFFLRDIYICTSSDMWLKNYMELV